MVCGAQEVLRIQVSQDGCKSSVLDKPRWFPGQAWPGRRPRLQEVCRMTSSRGQSFKDTRSGNAGMGGTTRQFCGGSHGLGKLDDLASGPSAGMHVQQPKAAQNCAKGRLPSFSCFPSRSDGNATKLHTLARCRACADFSTKSASAWMPLWQQYWKMSAVTL